MRHCGTLVTLCVGPTQKPARPACTFCAWATPPEYGCLRAACYHGASIVHSQFFKLAQSQLDPLASIQTCPLPLLDVPTAWRPDTKAAGGTGDVIKRSGFNLALCWAGGAEEVNVGPGAAGGARSQERGVVADRQGQKELAAEIPALPNIDPVYFATTAIVTG